MATAGENVLLSQLLEQVGKVASDVSEVKATTAATAATLVAVIKQSDRTEAELSVLRSELEHVKAVYVTRAGVWRWVSLAALLASGATGSLLYAAVVHHS